MQILAQPKQSGSIAPRHLVQVVQRSNPDFRSPAHQDAQEFLSFLLNHLSETITSLDAQVKTATSPTSHSAASRPNSGSLTPRTPSPVQSARVRSAKSNGSKPRPTLIEDVFVGRTVTNTRCMNCEKVSRTLQDFKEFPLSVKAPDVTLEKCMLTTRCRSQRSVPEHSACRPTPTQRPFRVRLLWLGRRGQSFWTCQDSHYARGVPAEPVVPSIRASAYGTPLLLPFHYQTWTVCSKKELLSGDNKLLCGSCNSYAECYKWVEIDYFPPVLLIHFKRFEYSPALDMSSKLRQCITFDNRFTPPRDVHSLEGEDIVYELSAVVVHVGSSLENGALLPLCSCIAPHPVHLAG